MRREDDQDIKNILITKEFETHELGAKVIKKEVIIDQTKINNIATGFQKQIHIHPSLYSTI